MNVLAAAGVEFTAVVGHSSCEIGAVYAAGYLSAQDAIRVAYYRGFYAHLARGSGGTRGKMMAVGMGLAQAVEFCNAVDGGAELKVAASNSTTSCTLAGDADVVDEAKRRLDQNGTFARVLAVDTAYHSHHMQPCAAPYLEALRNCGVKALKPADDQTRRKKCQWYSSVWGANGRSRSFDDQHGIKLLSGQYWVDNLTSTVQFSQALSRALSEESHVLDLVLEIGPHPTLNGLSCEVIKALTGILLPYAGVLKRGQGATEAFADTLGLIWTSFPSPSSMFITLEGMHRAFTTGSQHYPAILKGLPTYPWDHDSLIWRESAASRLFRNPQSSPRHELLGSPTTVGEQHGRREVHWRHVLRLNELPWISGHTIQGEVLFPATGYLTMAYEAAVRLLVDDDNNHHAAQQQVRLVELHDIEMVRAMGLQPNPDSAGLEVLFTVHVTSQSNSLLTAEVACYSGDISPAVANNKLSPGLTAHFHGGVRLWLGPPNPHALPARTRPLLPMHA